MDPRPILYKDAWIDDETDSTFQATNPGTGETLGDRYPVSSSRTLSRLAEAGAEAAVLLRKCEPEQIALFLTTYAENLDANRIPIARLASLETGLDYETRLLKTEMDRTIDQLRQAAGAVVDRSWAHACIESDLNLRSMYEPLGGAVLVMGPSNFPFAYNGIAGGDFASAIAAGNPVLAKAHPLHPGTTRLLAEQALDASIVARLPPGSIQMFYNCAPEDGLALIRSPQIAGVGFTGSRPTGLSLKQAADETGTPIYLELSSINPIFITPGACAQRGESIAQEIAESMLAAAGQMCTSPGLLFVADDENSRSFVESLAGRLGAAPPRVMLSAGGVDHLDSSIQRVRQAGAEIILGGQRIRGAAARYAHTLLSAPSQRFFKDPEPLQIEMFGVAALIVRCGDQSEFADLASTLSGNLTASIYCSSNCSTNTQRSNADDESQIERLSETLRVRVGRLLNDKVPTGVAVRPAMVHGGPFPATGHPGSTAVGIPTSIPRFAARCCYDHVRQDRLPAPLRDANPTGSMRRQIDGRWTTDDVLTTRRP